MKINLQGKNFELTGAIKDYVLKRITNLEKLLSTMEKDGGEAVINFEVGKSSMHHKGGDVFHSDCLINIDGKKFYASSDKEDIYEAIDEIKESLSNEIRKNKDRKQTLFKRGAFSIKKMIKGISKRNPFTSKY
ncbi:MAG: ribosome-associated translation inhibitor RaiA [Candidatus Paceibacterota bacterium]